MLVRPATFLAIALAAIAQPSFDVASVKLNTSGDRTSLTRRGEDSLLLQNWPLRDIVLKAYDLKNYALIAPTWLASRNFDVNAKGAGKMTESELRKMLQSLLMERFQIKVHAESGQRDVFVLLPAKGGPKLSPAQDAGAFGIDISQYPDRTKVVCRHCTMDNFANVVADHVNRPVIDQSGLAGECSFTLEWSPTQNGTDPGPSIFTALSEQLGLRLEARKVPVPILVVDSIRQTPTDN
jgi:uncharacterized protein (TIGR03435 family)